MKFDGDNRYELSTGRQVYANNGIVGLSPSLEISEGYDGGFGPADWEEDALTNEEYREVADYMISLWQSFRAKYL